jgi:hypothetical protein
MDERDTAYTVLSLLEQDPRAGIVLLEILGPPPGLGNMPARLWEV